MKTKVLPLAALFLTPAFLAFQPHGTSISFAVAEGTSKTKTITNSVSMVLDDMSMLMNGQESPMMPTIDMNIESTMNITVTDEYVKMRDGAPAKLLRAFDALSQSRTMEMEMDMMGQVQNQDTSGESTSELEGTEVLFTWNTDNEEFTPSFPDEDGDEALLEGLAEDIDFRALLPDGEVGEGDSWKIEPIALKDVLTPGGDLKFEAEDAGDAVDMMGMDSNMGDFEDWLTEDVEGEVSATFEGTREAEDGTRVAVIKLAIEVENAVDLTEKMQEGLDEADIPVEGGEMEINSMDIEMALEGEATLLWNLAEGCAHSFELSTDLGLTIDISMSVSAGGMDMEIDQNLELSGTLTSTVGFE